MADDKSLWKGICAGEQLAFEVFFREFAPRLRGFLHVYSGGELEADDILQETFLQIWRRPSGYDPERGTLRQYLYGIARKRVAQKRRESAHMTVPRDFDRRNAAHLAIDRRANGDLSVAMREGLMHLDSNERALLWLRELEGYSYAELAEILQVPLGTVKSRLFAARESLRRIWKCKPGVNREGE
ncbi:MAG TPA: RNA polymerase sigma factor [Candidatus Acidoferrales bacterium]|nr:RNA polymerase sigma factor [Candidatus Acidoferrales bacterium]